MTICSEFLQKFWEPTGNKDQQDPLFGWLRRPNPFPVLDVFQTQRHQNTWTLCRIQPVSTINLPNWDNQNPCSWFFLRRWYRAPECLLTVASSMVWMMIVQHIVVLNCWDFFWMNNDTCNGVQWHCGWSLCVCCLLIYVSESLQMLTWDAGVHAFPILRMVHWLFIARIARFRIEAAHDFYEGNPLLTITITLFAVFRRGPMYMDIQIQYIYIYMWSKYSDYTNFLIYVWFDDFLCICPVLGEPLVLNVISHGQIETWWIHLVDPRMVTTTSRWTFLLLDACSPRFCFPTIKGKISQSPFKVSADGVVWEMCEETACASSHG